jgi:DNA-directed RNA polymerase subunit RPC12/RpoP
MVVRPVGPDMPKLVCPDCSRDVAMHELDTQTVAAGGEFTTTYRCPFCRTAFDDVAAML